MSSVGMSTGPQFFAKTVRAPSVLDELLHSLRQPLTSLRCSLELSIDEVAEQKQHSVSVALQQAEQVIGMIQLMREYLNAEQPGPETCPVALAATLRSVIGELTSIAAVRDVQLRLAGTCTATLPVPQARLRLALQYLIAATIEAQPRSGKVMLRLGEGPAGTVLRADGERGAAESSVGESNDRDVGFPRRPRMTNPRTTHDPRPAGSASVLTLRRVRLAIASRVLEGAGASLVFGDVDHNGFVLRIPRPGSTPQASF